MIEFAAAVFFLILTPGPGVLSAAGVGAGFGFRAGFGYVFGLFLGNNIVASLVISGLAAILLGYEPLRLLLMGISTAYLFYLAMRIGFAGAEIGFIAAKHNPGARDGIILQLVNPKAYAVSTALFTSFAFYPENFTIEIVIKLLIFNAIWVPLHLLWLYAGVRVHQLSLTPQQTRWVNIAMAVSLAAVVLLSALSLGMASR